jgi:hypothetical protein
MCYYEQLTIDGTVLAADCVPSLLTTALLSAWMFAFEPVGEDAVYLLRGVPVKWFGTGFSIEGINTSKGGFTIKANPEDACIRISLSLPPTVGEKPVYLSLRGIKDVNEANVLEGREYIKSIHGNRLSLNTENTHMVIRIKT